MSTTVNPSSLSELSVHEIRIWLELIAVAVTLVAACGAACGVVTHAPSPLGTQADEPASLKARTR